MTVSEAQDDDIRRVRALRVKAWAFDYEMGFEFSLQVSRGWKRAGIEGLRDACDFLAGYCAHFPGAYDVYHAALIAVRSQREGDCE